MSGWNSEHLCDEGLDIAYAGLIDGLERDTGLALRDKIERGEAFVGEFFKAFESVDSLISELGSDLDAKIVIAYDDGHDSGYVQGMEGGFTDGEESGFIEGYNEGAASVRIACPNCSVGKLEDLRCTMCCRDFRLEQISD